MKRVAVTAGLTLALLASVPPLALAGATVRTDKGPLAVNPLTQGVNDKSADVIFDGGVYYAPPRANIVIRARSLQLLHGATLVLGSDTATIEVLRLVSQQGSIVSFDKPHRVAAAGASANAAGANGGNGENGASGGGIALLAGTVDAQTPLLLDESGQDGGQGGAGAKGAKGSTGAQGTPAKAISVIIQTGAPPVRQWQCATPAGAGGKGGTGLTGGDGGVGGLGGAGGSISVALLPGDATHIRAVASAGRGGFGGASGAGGDGGDRGPGGAGSAGVCSTGAVGTPGDTGPSGKDRARERSADGHAGIISVH